MAPAVLLLQKARPFLVLSGKLSIYLRSNKRMRIDDSVLRTCTLVNKLIK